MFEEYTLTQIAGRVLIALVFMWVGVLNMQSWSVWAGRMAAQKVPFPKAALAFGFVVQYAGALMILADFRPDIGAALLVGFVAVATVLFQRYWEATDLPQRRTTRVAFFNNLTIIGGLLLLT